MKIIITEPTDKQNTKSVGCFFIENAVKQAGYDISYVDFADINKENCDVLLYSVHHVRDIFKLAKSKKTSAKLTIGGGHVMNQPYPFLHFFDIICVGEGEEWIVEILKLYENCSFDKEKTLQKSIKIKGTLIIANRTEPIEKIYVSDISINPKYLNESFSEGHSDTWYIETARGCRSKCAYCELGWTTPYRENNIELVKNEIDYIAKDKIKKINIFAPDDYSVSSYEDILDYIIAKGLHTNFGSMRIDRFKNNEKQNKNFLFRIGVDGLSERIRKIINKPNSNDDIYSLITGLIEKGFVMFKMFMIFSYYFEKNSDWFEFVGLIERIKAFAKKTDKTVFLRIKFTPFIPNPLTPLENIQPYYNIERRKQIDMFFLNEKYQRSNVVIINDGILEPYSYYSQVYISRGSYEDIDINLLKNPKRFNFLSENLVKKQKLYNNIITHIPKEKREKTYQIINKRINENI